MNKILEYFRTIIPERSPLRLQYHKISAIIATLFYGFPSNRLKIIAVTGTSGKSSTVELIWYILQKTGHKCGSLSSINFHIGDKTIDNTTLRTTLRPWTIQKFLRKMVWAKCEYCVIEVSSHAIDQNRIWGVNIDTALCTNVYDKEHLDYHGTFAEYMRAKIKLFKDLNAGSRKPNIKKIAILNRDDEQYEYFNDLPADKKWRFSKQKPSDIQAQDVKMTSKYMEFVIQIPNQRERFKVPLIGHHNLYNILAALTVGVAHGVPLANMAKALVDFPGIPGRLEPIDMGQQFGITVDFSYKPSGLKAVLTSLRKLTDAKITVVWGGAGGRPKENWEESAKILRKYADEIVLTTDDPYTEDPKKIAKIIRKALKKEEGDGFFEIEDRYEAIRYAIYTAQKNHIVLVAGRGHEKKQTIGKQVIPFDDREVCREILSFAYKQKLIKKREEHHEPKTVTI